MGSQANWGALLKRQFGPAIDPMPSDDTIAADVSFVAQDKQNGEEYTAPVSLQHEGGAAYNVDHSAFAIGTAIDSVVKRATLTGAEIAVFGDLPIGMMTQMSKSKGESNRAYDQGVALKIENLMKIAEIRRELALLYGSGTTGLANLGVVSAVQDQTTTNLDVTVTRASYAAGLWSNLIGLEFDFHTSGGTSHTANAAAKLVQVNKQTGALKFTKSGSDTSFAAADQIRFRGARVLSMVGLQGILENTGSLFGIDAAVYPQWKAETYSVGGPLTFDKVLEGLSGAQENGRSEGVNLYVCGRQWTDLLTDEAALVRRGDEVSKTYKRGAGAIEFETLIGPVKIKPHRFMKQGIAMALPVDAIKRIGSTDITFRAPGSKNDWFWTELPNNMGARLKAYQDQAVLIEKPYHATLFTGILSTSDVVPA